MNLYPYSNFHDMNLDWIINEVKKAINEWLQMQENFKGLKDDFEELKTYVQDYFKNLNVQEEINNKIDDMIADGSFWSNLKDILPFVSPEMFPDGGKVTAKSFNDALASGSPVYCTSGNTYDLNEDVIVKKGNYLNLNNSTLNFVNASLLIKDDGSHENVGAIVENGKVKSSGTAIKIDGLHKSTVRNITILNSKVGIHHVTGYELLCDNVRIDECEIGIIEDTGDSTFTNIFGRDNQLPLKLNSGRNYFNNFHFWILDKNLFIGSYMIEDNTQGGANNVFNYAYFDTYNYGVKKTGLGELILNNSTFAVLKNILDATQIEKCYFLYVDSELEYKKISPFAIFNDTIVQAINNKHFFLSNNTDCWIRYNLTNNYKEFLTNNSIYNRAINVLNFNSKLTFQSNESYMTKDGVMFNFLLQLDSSNSEFIVSFPNYIGKEPPYVERRYFVTKDSAKNVNNVDCTSSGIKIYGTGLCPVTFEFNLCNYF